LFSDDGQPALPEVWKLRQFFDDLIHGSLQAMMSTTSIDFPQTKKISDHMQCAMFGGSLHLWQQDCDAKVENMA